MGYRRVSLAVAMAVVLSTQTVLADGPNVQKGPGYAGVEDVLHHRHAGGAGSVAASDPIARNFTVLGHSDVGDLDSNGDVWVQGDTAYVGTWSVPCTGRGVKIVDVSDLRHPSFIATAAARDGTSAEDMVARRIDTRRFHGNLLAVGIQRCGEDPALDNETFGLELWDVSRPSRPRQLSTLGLTTGGGGIHELDLFQRGSRAYVLAATPFSEFFDPNPGGDFRIIDVTNPRHPVQVGEWGAGEHGLTPGPFYGLGSFGAAYDHSVRISRDKQKAYVSYWDLGVLTLDIRDVTDPQLLTRTRYPALSDGDAHSVVEYRNASGRSFLLQNDEDFDPRSPATIRYGASGRGLASESPGGTALWLQPQHRLSAAVVQAADEGCEAADYPAGTAGKIAVVTTLFPFFDPAGGPEPACMQQEQEAAAAEAGAVAVVHDFIATATSPQWFDSGEVDIPVVFTSHATAQGIVAAGSATLIGNRPSFGFLRVFDARTGRQVAKFDSVKGVHSLPAPAGDWSIHNTEVRGNRAYSAWYSNGIVALDLSPLDRRTPGNPRLVGQWVPPAGTSHAPGVIGDFPEIWGVAVRGDGVIFASDMNSGLWIIRPTGPARP
jgi:hypothetical protein